MEPESPSPYPQVPAICSYPEESYRLWCVLVCDLETSRIGAPYIYDISSLRVNFILHFTAVLEIAL